MEEITLKLALRKLKGYIREIVSEWYIVLLFALPIAAYMLFGAWKFKPTYTATMTFMLNDAQSGAGSGLASFIGQISGSGDGQSNLSKIVELSRSRRIMANALFQQGVVNGVNDYYANHLIRDFDFQQIWKKDTTGLNGFFFKSGDFDHFDRVAKTGFARLYERLTDRADPLFTSGYSKQSGILDLELKTRNEDLSIQLANVIFDKLSEFYVGSSIEKQEHTVEVLKNKMDSLKRSIQGKEISAAQLEDRQRGLIFESDKVQSKLLRGDAQLSGAGFGEIIKNYEIADFTLKNNIPFIRAIDLPLAPIKPEKPSKTAALITGLGIGFFISVFFILSKNAFKEA